MGRFMAINFTPSAAIINSGPDSTSIARQLALAQQLQAQGMSGKPIYGGWEGAIGPLLSNLAGAYLGYKGSAAQDAEKASYAKTLADAASAGAGAKPWVSPDTFQGNNGTVQAGDVAPGTSRASAMARVLASNPLTVGEGASMTAQDIASQDAEEERARERQATFQHEDTSQKTGFTHAEQMAKTARDAAAALQQAGFTHADKQPKEVGMGGELVDPTTGKVIAQNNLTNPRSAAAAAVTQYIREGEVLGMPRTADDISNFSAQFQAKAAAEKNLVGKGSDAQFLDGTNAAVGHLQSYKEMATALNNGDYQLFNRLANAWSKQTGNPAPTNLQSLANVVGGEIVKGVIGAAGGEGDRDAAKATLIGDGSPAQMLQGADTMINAMHTQFDARELKAQQTTGHGIKTRLLPATAKAFGYAQDAAAAANGPRDPVTGGPIAPSAAPAPAALPQVRSAADYNALPAGATYKDPQGNTRTKGGKSAAWPNQ